MDFWRIFSVVLHGSQILDARYWMPDHALEIVAFIQYQVTSIQHQRADSDPFHGRHALLSSKNFILRTIHHVIIRGTERRKIFLNKADLEDFVDRLNSILPEAKLMMIYLTQLLSPSFRSAH